MNGMKRLGQSDSNLDTKDSAFRSKRIMVASTFDNNKAESSNQHLMKEPPFDVQRAESSRQHVRALNTQFASWVQLQMQNHPDELWEDGVQDYLTYASEIMEKFRDVVDWLKAITGKAENVSVSSSQTAGKKLIPEAKNNEIKLFHEKSGFGAVGTTSSFTSPWSSGPLLNNQAPLLFGSQSSGLLNQEAADDVDGDDVEQPSSPSVKKTEEKGISVVHEVKCKLYVKSTDPADKDAWKDRGMGQLSIKCKEGAEKATTDSKPTIVVRNDVGKVLLNALLYPGIKTNLQKNSIVAIFHTSGDAGGSDGGKSDSVVARTYLIRTKTEEERNKLAAVIQEYAPTA
ncbi:PREDICTED: uncharacterized protein LOC104596191 [Nelumbo nucifera]|uniref:RanBD1 domain-containing protein n=2 Tax=Nelumbo nucifera TaxID=4432 RepID=A0A822XFT4_NELNU|nr:PREDICTED: uncharacterized protein LOC104596191 [Nelumbo nucifera]DAD18762.1 TPA_asm: hypothetical protein HUJ06_020225 [Nelumbo nucifera]